MDMKRSLAFLGVEDLLRVGVASRRVLQLGRDDFLWRLDLKEKTNKSGVAIVLERQNMLAKAFELGIVAPTLGGAEEAGTGGVTAWYDFHVTIIRGLVRQREGAETRGPGALLNAARDGNAAKLRRLIRWVMVDVNSTNQVRERGGWEVWERGLEEGG